MPLGELQEDLHVGEGLPLDVYGCCGSVGPTYTHACTQ
jgi:hypothetical protein